MAVLVKNSWKQHQTAMTTSDDDVLAHDNDSQMQEVRAWNYKLCHSEHARNSKLKDAARSSTLRLPANKPMVVETSSKKHRFSLRRLFKHESHRQDKKKAVIVPSVPIPIDFMTRERHGAMTVSGKRVPFTFDAHKRRRKTTKPLPCIKEDHALSPVSSSQEAYRRRAYYSAKKEKANK
ncbi:hypothetical protein KXD40_007987 [Peronospora effusa]|uniref:Uncharacterized protein n=1 Tax=Peronospora effusa TaxID=542832 RepID=A0A3M6VSD4_9STRA|nr:hypothetical protein DD238_004168 [Peronospora effusa]RQM15082.1 hypothetical protein DD237_004391 [Peronospora effusa]UIZ23607.1 hypothetical protein KXD40_007987 [Peronospora effusa]CAI5701350.1 unnamed protein product [Peronospora effusa]